jgi:adenylate kinase family enzyme
MKKKLILLCGAPGCGKGTFIKEVIRIACEQLKKKLAIAPVSDALRIFLDENPTLAPKIKADMEKGLLVEDAVVNDIFMKAVHQLEQSDEIVYVFDGAPRTPGQVHVSLTEAPKVLGVTDIMVVVFSTPDHICGMRAAKRERLDDTEEAFGVRWIEYTTKTIPAISHIVRNASLAGINVCHVDGQFIRTGATLYIDILSRFINS